MSSIAKVIGSCLLVFSSYQAGLAEATYIEKLVVFDTETNSVVGDFVDGASLRRGRDTICIEPLADKSIGSIRIRFDRLPTTVENYSMYCFFGGSTPLDVTPLPATASPGQHSAKLEVFNARKARGTIVDSLDVEFRVDEEPSTAHCPAKRPAGDVRRMELLSGQLPPRRQIVFAGSSTIQNWSTLQSSFPSIDLVNTGLGGKDYHWLRTNQVERILRYRPSTVVLYAGDNDLGIRDRRGHLNTPDYIARQAKQLIENVTYVAGQTRFIIYSVKLSPSKVAHRNRIQALNTALSNYALSNPCVTFIDTNLRTVIDGQPDGSLYHSDGLHLNADGYKIWTELLRPHLAAQQAP